MATSDGHGSQDEVYQVESENEPLLGSHIRSDSRQGEDRGPAATMSSTPKVLPQYIATLVGTLGALGMGCVLGYSSPAGYILTSNETMTEDPDVYLNDDQNSWFSSVSNVGALIGGLTSGFLINYFGRKPALIYSVVPITIGWVLIVAGQNFAMLVLGRIFSGYYCGFMSVAVPTYISEFSSPHIRGTLGSGFQVMVVTGILFAYCMGAAFPDDFRWIAGICAIIPCIFSVAMIFNKESPMYLVSKGEEKKAEDALKFFRGKNYTGINEEIQVMQRSLEESNGRKASLKDLKTPYILKPFLIAMGLMFFQQFSGINAVLFNLTSIFKDAGTDISDTLSSIIIGVVQVLATVAGAAITDRAGRKILLLLSAGGMALSLAALGIFFYFKETGNDVVESLGWLPLTSLVIFMVTFSIGYGPMPWVMMSEIFTPEVKELAVSLATTSNWMYAFITTLIYEPLKGAINTYGVYWMFAGFCVVNVVFVVTFIYETKGKTLQEINAHFGAPISAVDHDEKKDQCSSDYL